MKRPSKSLMIKIAASLALVLSLLIVCWSLWLMSANKQLKQAREALISSGFPSEMKELLPSLPEGRANSAPLYEGIIALIGSQNATEGSLAGWAEIISEQDRKKGNSTGSDWYSHEAYLRAWDSDEGQLIWGMIQSAAERGPAVFDRDYETFGGWVLPNIIGYKRIQVLLREKSISEVALGRHDQARETLLISLRAANALALEPMLVQQLIRVAQFDVASQAIPLVLSGASADESYLSDLRDALDPLNDADVFSRAIMGEYLCGAKAAYDLFESDEWPDDYSEAMADVGFYKLYGSFLLRPLRREDFAHTSRMMVLSNQEQLHEVYAQPSSRSEEYLDNKVPKRCIMTRMITPAYRNFSSDALASYRLNALIIELYSKALRKRPLPASLDELGLSEEMTRNPYTGEQVSYEVTEGGFILELKSKRHEAVEVILPDLN